VARERRAVESIASTFADPASGPREEAARLLDPPRERADLEALLVAAGFRDPEAAADVIELARARLPVAFVEQAVASPDPDRALVHFRDLALRGSVGLMALLRDHPRLLRMLGTLFGTSDRLSDLLIRHPEMWEPFIEGLGERLRSSDELRVRLGAQMAVDMARAADASARAAAAADTSDAEEELEVRGLRVVRRFQAEEILRVGLHDVAGSLEAGEVGDQLSAIAEVCLEASVAIVTPALVARMGQPATALTILALGSLGAREMRYGSDLDLVFLYGAEGESSARVGHPEWFARASQRVIGAVEVMLEEGRLYRVDTGLRPSGAQGLLVTSYRAFARYYDEEAAPWERVPLLRARVVYSTEPPAGRAALEDQLTALAFDKPIDEAAFRAELRRLRERVGRERGSVPQGSRHVRFDPGGVMDVEFMVALGQLQHARDPGVRTTSTAAVIERLVALGWPASLRDDYGLLRRVAQRLRLLLDRPEDVVSPRDLGPLARTLDLPPATLAARLDAAMTRVRAIFLQVFAP
jgi:glutamate-ammonia-ligase adenylyltransferase